MSRPRAQAGVNADKRCAVEIALKEFPKLSSREIAKVCAVGDDMVNDMRKQLPENGSSPRTGADGKERKMPARNAVTAAGGSDVLLGEGSKT